MKHEKNGNGSKSRNARQAAPINKTGPAPSRFPGGGRPQATLSKAQAMAKNLSSSGMFERK